MSTNQPEKVSRGRGIDNAGDDTTEGHAARSNRIEEAESVNRDIDSTEGHRFKGAVEDADTDTTEGHRWKGAVEDADTEGHAVRGRP